MNVLSTDSVSGLKKRKTAIKHLFPIPMLKYCQRIRMKCAAKN